MLALDRSSARQIDSDGMMRVRGSLLSRCEVSKYYGREVASYQELGLDRDRLYSLFRPAEELEKGAPSLAGKPLLLEHQAISAEDLPRELIIGSVQNPVFKNGELFGDLVIWSQEAIDLVRSGERCALSLGYRYKPTFESGRFQGEPYALTMRNIEYNHAAICSQGRVVGAVVADSADDAKWARLEIAILGFFGGTS